MTQCRRENNKLRAEVLREQSGNLQVAGEGGGSSAQKRGGGLWPTLDDSRQNPKSLQHVSRAQIERQEGIEGADREVRERKEAKGTGLSSSVTDGRGQ